MNCNIEKLNASLKSYKEALEGSAPVLAEVKDKWVSKSLASLDRLGDMVDAIDSLLKIRDDKVISETKAKEEVRNNPIMGNLKTYKMSSELGFNESRLRPTGFNSVELKLEAGKIKSADGLVNEDGTDFELDVKAMPLYDKVLEAITSGRGLFDRAFRYSKESTSFSAFRMLMNGIGRETEKREVNHNVAIAVYASVMNTLANNYYRLSSPRDMNYVYYLHGKDPDMDVVTSEMAEDLGRLSSGGVSELELAESIGKDAVASLGLLEDMDKDVMAFRKLQTEFGVIGLAMAYDLGILLKPEDNDMMFRGSIRVAKMTEQGFGTDLASIKEGVKYVETSFDTKLTDALNIYDSPVSDVSNVKTKTSIGNKVSSTLKEHELRQQGIAYNINSGWDNLLEMFTGSDGKLQEQRLMYALGYTDKEKMETLSGNARITAEGRNAGIAEKVALLQELEERRTGEDFYFDFDTATNDRSHLFSKVNPQTEKELFRWLIAPSLPAYTITEGMLEEVVRLKDQIDTISEVEDLQGSAENYKEIAATHQFMFGVVQAFDGVEIEGRKVRSADNLRNSSVVEEFQRIRKAREGNPDLGKEVVNQIVEAGKAKGDSGTHIGHVLLALANLDRLVEGEGEFETDMLVEFDGKTNGLSYRMMQYAVGPFQKYLPKVGLRDGKDTITSLGDLKDVKEGEKELDSYEVNGELVQEVFKEKLEASYVPGSLGEESIRFVQKELSRKDSRLPNLTMDEQGLKAVRNLLKGPVMIFVYGAGIAKIAQNVSISITNEYLAKVISSIPIGREGFMGELGKYRLTEKGLDTAIKVFGMEGKVVTDAQRSSVRKAVEELKNKQVNVLDSSTSGNYIAYRVFERVSFTYGGAISEALKKEFEAHQDLNGELNGAAGAVFKMFEVVYEAELRKARADNGGKLTGNQVKEIRAKLEKMLPSMRTFNSRGRDDGLTLIKGKAGSKLDTGSTESVQFPGISVLVMADGLEGVGAKLPVLPTHSADSHTMAKTLKESVEADPIYGQFTQVFDAKVQHVADTVSGPIYNKNWYEDNRDNSILDNVLEMLEEVSKEYDKVRLEYGESDLLPSEEVTARSATVGELHEELNQIISRMEIKDYAEADKKLARRQFKAKLQKLQSTKTISDKNRENIFSGSYTVMQMNGGFGAYRVKGQESKKAVTEVKEIGKKQSTTQEVEDFGIIGKSKIKASKDKLKDLIGSTDIEGNC